MKNLTIFSLMLASFTAFANLAHADVACDLSGTPIRIVVSSDGNQNLASVYQATSDDNGQKSFSKVADIGNIQILPGAGDDAGATIYKGEMAFLLKVNGDKGTFQGLLAPRPGFMFLTNPVDVSCQNQ